MSEIPSFEQLATQDSLQAFYCAIQDRISVEGVDEHYSNLYLDIGPRHLYLEDDDGITYEIRTLSDQTLEITCHGEGEGVDEADYQVGMDNSGIFAGGQVDQADETITLLPLTEVSLAHLSQKIKRARPTMHESFGERMSRIASRMEAAFAQCATEEEMRLYVSLADELLANSSPEPRKLIESLSELRLRVIKRATEQ